MSETDGFPPEGGEAPASPGPVQPAAPRQFTADELNAARDQLAAQGETFSPVAGPAEDQSQLGMQALSDGAQAAEVDPAELLRAIRQLQSQVDTLNAEKRQGNAPDVVKYTTAAAGHLQVLADTNPVIHADPDHTWMPALEHAAAAVNAASDAAEGGDPAAVTEHVAALRRFVDRHARKHPALDYGYIRDLLDEADEAAHKLAA